MKRAFEEDGFDDLEEVRVRVRLACLSPADEPLKGGAGKDAAVARVAAAAPGVM